jgi:hypothetical protein
METFVVNRSLLNPKFEGYKLDLIAQEKAVQCYDLQYKPTQATTSSRALLSFQDVQSRITHNHLCISPEEGAGAIYVDADYNVVVIELDHVSRSLIPCCSARHRRVSHCLKSKLGSAPARVSSHF